MQNIVAMDILYIYRYTVDMDIHAGKKILRYINENFLFMTNNSWGEGSSRQMQKRKVQDLPSRDVEVNQLCTYLKKGKWGRN